MLALMVASAAPASDIRCLLPNNDPDCRPAEIAPVQNNTPQDQGLDQFECKDDSDCVIVKPNTCGLKSVFKGTPNDGSCLCLKGSVVRGCVPKSQLNLYRE